MQGTEEDAPQLNLVCSLCDEKLNRICMLSPDWSASSSFEGLLPFLRKHLKEKHGIEAPTP